MPNVQFALSVDVYRKLLDIGDLFACSPDVVAKYIIIAELSDRKHSDVALLEIKGRIDRRKRGR